MIGVTRKILDKTVTLITHTHLYIKFIVYCFRYFFPFHFYIIYFRFVSHLENTFEQSQKLHIFIHFDLGKKSFSLFFCRPQVFQTPYLYVCLFVYLIFFSISFFIHPFYILSLAKQLHSVLLCQSGKRLCVYTSIHLVLLSKWLCFRNSCFDNLG